MELSHFIPLDERSPSTYSNMITEYGNIPQIYFNRFSILAQVGMYSFYSVEGEIPERLWQYNIGIRKYTTNICSPIYRI